MSEDTTKKWADRQVGGTRKKLDKKWTVSGWLIAGAVIAALVIGLVL